MPTRSHARRRALIAAFGACLAGGVAALAPPWWGAARVLLATTDGERRDLPAVLTRAPHAVVERDDTLAGLRTRRYAPRGIARTPHAVLLPGAHPRGIDEPRVQRMARALAAEGLTVHATELPALRALRLAPEITVQIAAVVGAASERAGGERVTAFGISVTGGLLLQAALEPGAADALACIVAVGAHHDLRSVARAYARSASSGRQASLDPYGARVLATAYADALLPPDDVATARQAIDLHVSEQYEAARAAVARLSPAARELVAPLLTEPRKAVPQLMASVLEYRSEALLALSPAGKLHTLRVPVFLLHGEQDPVVPSSEAHALAAELQASDLPTRVLVTPLLRHAEAIGAPSTGDTLRLIDFMADVLATAERRAHR